MPELPEVETTRRGIAPHVEGRRVARVLVRQRQLRWPVSEAIWKEWPGEIINRVGRRAKYLLLHSDSGTALVHLGMSGSMRVLEAPQPPGAHDHVDIVMQGGPVLRYTDPRRFGAILWTTGPVEQHKLIRHLGPEPLGPDFDGALLFALSRGRSAAVKNFIMDARVVVGVGNIYASEALYRAGISPVRAAGRVSRQRYEVLAEAIRSVLSSAIKAGGTTLRDFVGGEGRPGYFRQELDVYDREGELCHRCGESVRRRVIGQRSSFYCPACQR
ncbi:MAG: bifunctional DNA-formamidopyrimidine glycosylase/DNA-(apurinic or apyrimidinic site) lyase [Xanthomonadales bacterium]|nr:bifunctional DNA-formamidopyrimidine glycosylase/DNA-(apurinic or apyrimidinic site) lyase [Xanthomonadales bacterium]